MLDQKALEAAVDAVWNEHLSHVDALCYGQKFITPDAATAAAFAQSAISTYLSAIVSADVAGLVAEWREAAEGVTPGPWKPETEALEAIEDEDRQQEVYVCSEDTVCDYTVLSTMGRTETVPIERKQANAAWIARCSPDKIGALLDALASISADLAAVKAENSDIIKERDRALEWRDHDRDRAEAAESALASERAAHARTRDKLAEAMNALEPFAKAAEYHAAFGDDRSVRSDGDVLVRHLRAARLAYQGGTDNG